MNLQKSNKLNAVICLDSDYGTKVDNTNLKQKTET